MGFKHPAIWPINMNYDNYVYHMNVIPKPDCFGDLGEKIPSKSPFGGITSAGWLL